MNIDAAGVVYEGDTALQRLSAVANAPIFTHDSAYFGREIVGGPMHSVSNLGRLTATAAVRILAGEKASDVRIPASTFAAPIFDWREMQRWGISEKNLPSGSEILFRNPTAWEQYRWQIALIFSVIFIQAALIARLLYEHRRRRLAEGESFRRMAELAHLNRVATAGELSASIAHEVKQPLAAMIAHSGAARRWLAGDTPNLQEVMASLKKIEFAGERAGDIVENLRSMFRKETNGRRPLDINKLVGNVLAITGHEIEKNSISVKTSLSSGVEPLVLGDQAQLEQVLLNLVVNAIEAMSSSNSNPRVLELKTAPKTENEILVSVADTGPGIGAENLEKMFDAYYTTKAHGMGMGLSICRSIIDSHGGRLWVSRGDRGLTFYVSLPRSN
jgi:signal transduction histidine kinase